MPFFILNKPRTGCKQAGAKKADISRRGRRMVVKSINKIKKINFYFNKIKYKLKITKIGIDNAAAVC